MVAIVYQVYVNRKKWGEFPTPETLEENLLRLSDDELVNAVMFDDGEGPYCCPNRDYLLKSRGHK